MNQPVNEYQIVINNEQIWKYFNENKNIDIENALLMTIDFMDTIFNKMSEDISINVNTKLLSYISDSNKQFDSIKHNLTVINENVAKINTDVTSSIIIQFMNLKKEYIEDVKQIVSNNGLITGEKIGSLIDKNNSHLLDKTTLLLNDVIPKNQHGYNKQIVENLNQFYNMISEDTSKLVKTINADGSLSEFIDKFETKYQTMMQTIQQPLYAFFTASEDRINKNIDVLKESSTTSMMSQNKVFEELGEFLGKYKGSSNKGKYGEQNLCAVLNSIYPTAEIKDTTGIKASGDFIMKRIEKPVILFENKEYDYNIPKEEIAKFIRDVDTQNTNGIFISQNSGITFKHNFQIEINKGNVLVYIQNCEYSVDKIKIAVDIIDSLSVRIQDLNVDIENNSISKEVLDDINAEYQSFISQKEMMITLLRDFQKKMTTQIEELSMPVLDKYLEPKYAYVKTRTFECDLCNVFSAASKQSLSAHKRGCLKKNKQPVLHPTFKPSTLTNPITPAAK